MVCVMRLQGKRFFCSRLFINDESFLASVYPGRKVYRDKRTGNDDGTNATRFIKIFLTNGFPIFAAHDGKNNHS